MKKELFFEKLTGLLNIRKGDKAIHLYKEKTSFSKMLADSVGKTGHIYAINLSQKTKKSLKENISFYTKKDSLILNSGTIDLIFIEKTLHNLKNLYDVLKDIKKYLTRKGKIMIYRDKSLFLKFKDKKIQEAIFLSGFKLKNKFNFKRTILDIYEKE